MSNEPTPRTFRRTAAQEFGESWRSPSVQKYLGADFGSTGAGAGLAAPRDSSGAAGGPGIPGSDLRLQQTLASIQRKEALAAPLQSSLGGNGANGITAYQPPPLGDALAADYRAHLQQYAQQLAAKDAEASALRLHVGDLKQQLTSAEGRALHAGEQVARDMSQAGHLEQQAAALERQLQEREQDLQVAQQQKRGAEQAAAAAKAQAAAVQKTVGSRASEFEKDRHFFKEQLERKDAELRSLEDAMKKQAVEVEKRSRDWAQREAELSATHSRSHGAAAAVHAELGMVQEKLDSAMKRVRVVEGDNSELRKQKAQVVADMRMLEELLRDSDAERRELHDKYVRLGERMEALVKEGKLLKTSASAETGAARSAVQEAIKDAEAAVKEGATLVSQVRQLQQRLEEEQGSRSQLKDKVQHKLAGAEQEVGLLRGELESKAKQLQGLQADMKTLQRDADSKLNSCEKQVMAFKDRISALKQEVEQERQRNAKAKAEGEALQQERVKMELQQQALKYERRIQELEVHCLQGGGAGGASGLLGTGGPAPRASVLDYIPRAEHIRLLEARLAAKEGDQQLELGSRVAQVEREWQWKLESKEQEIASLTARTRQLEDDLHTERQRSSSQAHKLGDESKRVAAQCLELQRELEVQTKEVARMKETLKDARSANADMDDDALSSSRQVARMRHALDGSQQALKEAQVALAQERKRCEEAQREAEGQGGRLADTARRSERLAGEIGELQAVLEQKQELITALQAESDAWSAKLMAHREYHEQEVEALRRQLKEDGDARVAALEQQCLGQTADLHHTRQQHNEVVGQMGQQHAAQVAHLEMQLAAAERCRAELHELTTALGSVKQEDVEALKGIVQDLQLRLKESCRERERMQKQHAGQLAVVAAQIQAKMAAFRTEQGQLKQQVESKLAGATADCQASYEAGLAALQQRLERQAAAADSQQAELAGQAARLKDGMQQLLAALRAEVPLLPEAVQQVLLDGSQARSQQQVAASVQQAAQAVRALVERAEAAAIDSALVAFEAALLPAGATRPFPGAGSSHTYAAATSPGSPRKHLSPSKRQQQLEAAAAAAAGQQVPPPSLEANEGRLEALLGRSQQLLGQLAAAEAQDGELKQQVAALEATEASYAHKFSQAKADSIQAAEAARAAAVAPLQAEVARLTERVQNLQQLHSSELAAIEAAARQQVTAAHGEAQAVVDRLTSSSGSLQQQLRGESQRAEGLSADLARLHDDLAKHTQRAATKIEVQDRELEMLKGRIREMEARDASHLQELRGLKQREREAAFASSGGSGLLGVGRAASGSLQQQL